MKQLYINVIRYRESIIAKDWNFPSFTPTLWRLYLNEDDGPIVTTATGSFPLQRNTIYIIPSWITFKGQNNTAVKSFHVHFDVLGLSAHTSRKLFSEPIIFKTHYDYNDTVGTILNNSRLNTTESVIPSLRVKSLIYQLLSEIIDKFTDEQNHLFNNDLLSPTKYIPLMEYIETNLGSKLGNTKLAEIAGLSESHFIRDFTSTIGASPSRYVTEQRIKEAARLLIMTNESISNIAYKMGYKDRFHFSRVFKKVTGISPYAYRTKTRA